tara:strand:- start:652 stop:2460 length:1809 start_codon:yes stop_codon:yes gene_type:complete
MKLNELEINELDGPLGDLKRWLDKSTHQSMYNKAADKMYKILKRKEQENGGKWRHTLGYYAMQIGRSFANIDYKNLHKTFKDKYGDEFPTLITELRIDIPSGKGMGIPRKKMPQIKSSDYPEFVDYLADNGASFTKETVPATSLKPVQKEFSKKGVEKQIKKLAKDGIKKPVIASSDDYIMDGHHRWLVALNTRDSVDIYRVNKPGKELLDLLLAFPKVYFKDIYNEDDIVEAPLVAKQSHIFQVISTLADRKDNQPFPIKFYDGGTMDVKPSTAKRIIDLYYKAEDKVKAQIMKYLPTYNGFKEIAIAAGAVKESAGVGKITKQNSTADVKPGETERQAKKFFGGNGKPKPLGVKGATPHQAFNLGMTENMSVTGTQRGQEARKKKLRPGSEAWFKHWFSLPLMKREDFEQAKSEMTEYIKENLNKGTNKLIKTKKNPDGFTIDLIVGGKQVGQYTHAREDDIVRNQAEIFPEYRNKGYGTMLLLAAIKTADDLGLDFEEDTQSLTPAMSRIYDELSDSGMIYGGNGAWAISPSGEIELEDFLNENFKDGKKPGRKGLAKRSGVDCSKPVGELRKIAKNSSGEKQRMAHWCANMKSGRKKS